MSMSRNDDYTTGNLLHFSYFKENCRLIATELSKQTKLKDTQEINFVVTKLMGATVFFIIENQKKLLLKFYKTL